MGGPPEVMILTISKGKDRYHEKHWQKPKEPAELASLPGNKADYPQEK
jgi:hypothetical protein